MADLSPGEIFVIIIAAFFLFGPKKLPDIGRAAGEAYREFKKGLHGSSNSAEETSQKKENL